MNNEHYNPLLDNHTNMEILISTCRYKDDVIKNLRQQIINLRELLLEDEWMSECIDEYQFNPMT
jgi:hypothetical protein